MSDNTVTLHTEPSHAQLRIAIYSDRPQLREDVHSAFGTSIAPDLPAVDVIDFATGPALIRALHNKELDLCVLDGETAPLGGMGLSYQINAVMTPGYQPGVKPTPSTYSQLTPLVSPAPLQLFFDRR